MNLERLFHQFMRLFGIRAIRRALNRLSRGGKPQPGARRGKQGAAQDKAVRDTRAATKRARQAARITRRLGR